MLKDFFQLLLLHCLRSSVVSKLFKALYNKRRSANAPPENTFATALSIARDAGHPLDCMVTEEGIGSATFRKTYKEIQASMIDGIDKYPKDHFQMELLRVIIKQDAFNSKVLSSLSRGNSIPGLADLIRKHTPEDPAAPAVKAHIEAVNTLDEESIKYLKSIHDDIESTDMLVISVGCDDNDIQQRPPFVNQVKGSVVILNIDPRLQMQSAFRNQDRNLLVVTLPLQLCNLISKLGFESELQSVIGRRLESGKRVVFIDSREPHWFACDHYITSTYFVKPFTKFIGENMCVLGSYFGHLPVLRYTAEFFNDLMKTAEDEYKPLLTELYDLNNSPWEDRPATSQQQVSNTIRKAGLNKALTGFNQLESIRLTDLFPKHQERLLLIALALTKIRLIEPAKRPALTPRLLNIEALKHVAKSPEAKGAITIQALNELARTYSTHEAGLIVFFGSDFEHKGRLARGKIDRLAATFTDGSIQQLKNG